MASNDDFEGLERDLELKGIIELNGEELGRGAYGRVYTIKYCETVCAAKEIHSILVEGVNWTSSNAANHRIIHERVSTMQ